MKKYKSYIFTILILLLILRVIVPQFDSFVESLQALKTAELQWIFMGIIIYFSGIPVLALQFTALAFKKLVFKLTLRVEAATLFANKLVPNGVGTISLNAFYLVKKNHTPSQATSILTMNTITSFVAYMSLIIFALVSSPLDLSLLSTADIPINAILFLLLLLFGACYTIYRATSLKDKIQKAWVDIRGNLISYKQRPKSVVIGLFCNGLGSSISIIAIMLSAKAIGIDLSFANALVAYTFGNIAAALVPTPGGIGSAEAGIYSGLVLVGINGTEAMTITLLYRLISYWIPILPGYYFFWGLKKDLLADYSIKRQKQN
jgi:uncharacterized protein (TIRG00374 family)